MLRTRAAETPMSETNLISQDTPLWTESMLWDTQCALDSGVGYKDNVLLSAVDARGTAISINGFDLVVIRLPLDGWQMEGVVIGEDGRYWRNIGTNSQDSFNSSFRVQRELPDRWQIGLELRSLYEKQVLDVTTRSAAPATALVEGYAITAAPSVRKDFKAGLWLQVEMSMTRWLLDAPLDDYWDFGPVATVGFNLGQHSDVTASYGASYQQHAQWVALDDYGRPLPPNLEVFQDQTEFAWRQYWDAHQHLRTSSRFIFAYDQDNGGGYFNYYQYQIVEDILWQTDDWQVKGSAQQIYEEYPVQGVGRLNGKFLNRNFLVLSLEVQRRLLKHLKGFAKVEYQRGHSNYADNLGDYTARTFTCGLRWEF